MQPKLRARVIAEWRGLAEPPPSRDTARPIGDPLARVMSALGLGDRMREDEIKNAWREVVGDFLANHSSPDALRTGTLIVRVLQPTLRYELERVKPQIVQKLRTRFGKTVREVRFRLG